MSIKTTRIAVCDRCGEQEVVYGTCREGLATDKVCLAEGHEGVLPLGWAWVTTKRKIQYAVGVWDWSHVKEHVCPACSDKDRAAI